MKMGITEWRITDEEWNTHTLAFEKCPGSRNIYLDNELIGSIPKQTKYCELFNFEYRFKALGKECRIVNMVGQKKPSLIFNGYWIDTNRKCTTSIPSIPFYGYFAIACSIVPVIVLLILAIKSLDAMNMVGAVFETGFVFLTLYFSNFPSQDRFSTLVNHLIRVLILLLILSAMTAFSVWYASGILKNI